MKRTRFFSILAALSLTLSVYAYDFQSGDLYYNITSSEEPYTVEVTYQNGTSTYSGLTQAAIPSEVIYDKQTYRVTSIGFMAFSGGDFTSITIPNSVTSIGEYAFGSCWKLTTITIPEGVTSIEKGTFKYCDRLKSVTIPSKVTSIGESAFEFCGDLTSITIPENVTTIYSGAFFGCSSLKSITIPSSVTSIGESAFKGCNRLASITVNATTPPTIQTSTFIDVNRSIPLYVPAGSLTAYQSNIYWKEFLNITESPTGIKPTTIIEGVYAQNGTIVVENETHLSVAIYDAVGRLVTSGSSLTQSFAVPNAGVYLVKVGERTMKIIVP